MNIRSIWTSFKVALASLGHYVKNNFKNVTQGIREVAGFAAGYPALAVPASLVSRATNIADDIYDLYDAWSGTSPPDSGGTAGGV